jgi:osmoprotectant transport system permease protein
MGHPGFSVEHPRWVGRHERFSATVWGADWAADVRACLADGQRHAVRYARPVLGGANVLQTIPSLALFGLLLPVPFLGDRAARLAIVALTGYALLPILRNTYAGIRSVDAALIDVANALGMTGWQRLTKVELPMAASVILAGLRTATVTWFGRADLSRRGVGG